MTEGRILVEVAYAREDEQAILTLEAEPGIRAQEAILQSGILQRFSEIDLKSTKIGVFGKVVKLDQVLDHGDRVEIYRPLVADPKEARRKRAAEGKAMRKGRGDAGD